MQALTSSEQLARCPVLGMFPSCGDHPKSTGELLQTDKYICQSCTHTAIVSQLKDRWLFPIFGSLDGTFLYHENQSSQIRISDQFQLRCLWAQFVKSMMSSAIWYLLFIFWGNQRQWQWPITFEDYPDQQLDNGFLWWVLGVWLGGLQDPERNIVMPDGKCCLNYICVFYIKCMCVIAMCRQIVNSTIPYGIFSHIII